MAVGGGIDFVSTDQVSAAAEEAGLDEATTDALVDDYGQAQLRALKAGLLAAAIITLISLASTKGLPSEVPARDESEGRPESASSGAGTA